MHKIHGNLHQIYFFSKFRKPSDSHPTRFFHLNYVKPIPKLVNKCKYGISNRGPFVWINFLSTTEKQNNGTTKFKAVSKSKLFSLQNEVSVF